MHADHATQPTISRMNGELQARRSVAPWVTAALALAYGAELWREGVLNDMVGALAQILFAAPLVVAAGVVVAVVEQEIRVHAISIRLRRWLLWTPRALLVILVAFLALFSLDVFVEGSSATDIAIGLLMHNLPALAVLVAGVAAWRWPWVGALGLVAFAAWWLAAFSARGFFPSVFLLLAVLPLTVAALFLLSWRLAAPASSHSPGHA